MDLTKETDVVNLMKSSKNTQEWNDNCDKVRHANNGEYPSFWFMEILISGLAENVCNSWEKENKNVEL